MSDTFSYLWLIPVLPFLAAAITMLLGYRVLGKHAHWPCVLAVAASAILAIINLSVVSGDQLPKWDKDGYDTTGQHVEEGEPVQRHRYYTWFKVTQTKPEAEEEAATEDEEAEQRKAARDRNAEIGIDFRDDALTSIMLVTVCFIGSLIAVYSIGYMHDDPGYPRFFAAVALFIFSMVILVIGDNFVLMFAGWEGVGLCSYLLIGFWFHKPSAANAARKAFLVTRIGDLGLMLGIILLWINSGYQLNFDAAFEGLVATSTLTTVICLLLFCGAVGKSAQLPLHVWLPDAMEGPTPVSALIHAATMVTAGVYLVARCTPLFIRSPDAQLLVGCIGAATAIFAALIALTQNDLKRVMAYSTLSQLGYMFLALGCAVNVTEVVDGKVVSHSVTTFAVAAAIFHLFTHAFFKALLFMSSGSVMHAMGGIIDMNRFGGLRKLMPYTHATFLIGALALIAIPPFAGFWSKDEILASASQASHASKEYGGIYTLLLWVGIITAGLTGFYTSRAYFRTFWGEEKIPEEAGHHAHESPRVMTIPLIVLAVFAFGVGLLVGTPTGWFEHHIDKMHESAGFPKVVEHEFDYGLMAIGTFAGLAGIGIAYLMYVRKPGMGKVLGEKVRPLQQLSYNKFYVDETYDKFVVKNVEGVAKFSAIVDLQVLDNLIDIFAQVPRHVGSVFRPIQNGLLQFYALAMVLGLTVFLIALARTFPW